MNAIAGRRRSGLLVPLFSSPSSSSWGIGDIGDVAPLTAWLRDAGQRVLQLLPLNEMASGQQSPYSAISAMAIDPIFIDIPAVEDWIAIGAAESMTVADREGLSTVRAASRVEHAAVRRLKAAALSASFDHFYDHEWCTGGPRAAALRAFVAAQAWWVDDYALFCAIRNRESERPWIEWPEPLRQRDSAALKEAREQLVRDLVRAQYFQWVAHTQWLTARAAARANRVELFGDLPFMVDADSADVWAHQECFRLDLSVGAPPDAFSATGQDWGMPVYDWPAMAKADYRWLRDRARRSADLYDGYRVDHLVGFYRTYARPHAGGDPFFTPASEADQVVLGARVLNVFKASGAEIIAEDLGTVPEFVRASMAELGVPGFKVLRWERKWDASGQPFRDPTEYPENSVAASGTHDTETLSSWWAEALEADRRALTFVPAIQRLAHGVDLLDQPYDPVVKDVLLGTLFGSRSALLLLPIQDAFGWRDRINEPATVNDENWTFRLPWPCDRLDEIPEARACQAQLRAWATSSARS